MKERFVALKESTPALSQIAITDELGLFIVSSRYPVLVVQRFSRFSNTLEGAKIVASFHEGFPEILGWHGRGESREIQKLEFRLDLVRQGVAAFVSGKDEREFSPESLGDEIVRVYLDIAEKREAR
jgi:hypothetical protein